LYLLRINGSTGKRQRVQTWPKVVINFLQGTAVTQTMLGGLTINPVVESFVLVYTVCAKNSEIRLSVNKVIVLQQ